MLEAHMYAYYTSKSKDNICQYVHKIMLFHKGTFMMLHLDWRAKTLKKIPLLHDLAPHQAKEDTQLCENLHRDHESGKGSYSKYTFSNQ